MQLYNGSSQYVALNTTKTLHSKAGKIHSILLTGSGTGTLTLYDNTSATGTVLFIFDYTAGPLRFEFDRQMPLAFATGLTAVTSANVRAFIITEA
jgi:hypothetical protein